LSGHRFLARNAHFGIIQVFGAPIFIHALDHSLAGSDGAAVFFVLAVGEAAFFIEALLVDLPVALGLAGLRGVGSDAEATFFVVHEGVGDRGAKTDVLHLLVDFHGDVVKGLARVNLNHVAHGICLLPPQFLEIRHDCQILQVRRLLRIVTRKVHADLGGLVAQAGDFDADADGTDLLVLLPRSGDHFFHLGYGDIAFKGPLFLPGQLDSFFGFFLNYFGHFCVA
jgi:hypothetical protein